MTKLTLRVNHDSDVDCPADNDCEWKLHSFSRRHFNYKHPSDVGLGELDSDGNPTPENAELAEKLRVGHAFILSCFQHGNTIWSLKGTGPQCRWDTAQNAGLLVWDHPADEMGAKTVEERQKDARRFLETYNAWCNGETYWWALKDEEGEVVESCGGYIGPNLDHMWESILDAVGDRDLDFADSDHGSADDVRRELEKFKAKQKEVGAK